MRKIVLLLLICFGAYAQKSGTVSGKIMDREGHISLPGATVTLAGKMRYTFSSPTGDFTFLQVPVGDYTVEVSYIGYVSARETVQVHAGENAQLNFILDANAGTLNEVIIVGDLLRGQARALNQQRNNPNITNIISSDQVGRFPDANIGDALKRVPGITMQNDQGEARNIIVRGLAPSLNSVTLNGDRIPSAEGDNRNVQMDLIPSDMISSIEVNKTLTSDMDGDAIGGSVNLVTRAAPNGQRISTTVAGGYAPIRHKATYTGGLVYGNRYLNQRLGAVISASVFENNFGSDNVEAVWSKGKKDQVYVEELDIRKYDVQRVRRSGAIALDYKINDRNVLYANAMYNWRDDRENRFRARYRGIKPSYNASDDIIGYTGDIRRETKGGVDDKRNKNRRLEEQKVQNYAVRGEHLLTPKLDVDWQANYSKAREFRPSERYMEFHTRGLSFIEDMEDPTKPYIIAPTEKTSDYSLRVLSQNHDNTEETELGAKLNFRIPFTVISDQKGRVRFGGRVRIKEKRRDNIYYEYEPVQDWGKLSSLPTQNFSGENWQAGNKYYPGVFGTAAYLGKLNLDEASQFNKEPVPSEYLSSNYEAAEKITSGYVRWDQDLSEKLGMILGVRVENTRINYRGNYVMDEEQLVGVVNNKNDYTHVLPSVTFRYDIRPETILRAAFTTSLARPNYYSLAPYVSVQSEDAELRAGNPQLKATKAMNFDLMGERYFRSVGILSAGLYYKNLRDFIYAYRNEKFTREDFSNLFPNQANPVAANENWLLIQDRNGDKVSVYGFELALQRKMDFLPGRFLKGISTYLNYTRTFSSASGVRNADGELREGTKLPGAAPHMLNASLAWENRKFSTRISLNYTSAYLDELGGEAFDDRFYDKQLFIDVNAAYKITASLRVFAEGNNLSNQPLRYYQGTKERTAQMEYYRARYNVGLKFDL